MSMEAYWESEHGKRIWCAPKDLHELVVKHTSARADIIWYGGVEYIPLEQMGEWMRKCTDVAYTFMSDAAWIVGEEKIAELRRIDNEQEN